MWSQAIISPVKSCTGEANYKIYCAISLDNYRTTVPLEGEPLESKAIIRTVRSETGAANHKIYCATSLDSYGTIVLLEGRPIGEPNTLLEP